MIWRKTFQIFLVNVEDFGYVGVTREEEWKGTIIYKHYFKLVA